MITKKYIIQNWHLFYFNYKKAKFWFRFRFVCFLQYISQNYGMGASWKKDNISAMGFIKLYLRYGLHE